MTGPIEAWETGISLSLRNSKSASRDPRVEAGKCEKEGKEMLEKKMLEEEGHLEKREMLEEKDIQEKCSKLLEEENVGEEKLPLTLTPCPLEILPVNFLTSFWIL